MKRPNGNEYAPYYNKYIEKIAAQDIFKILKKQINEIEKLCEKISPKKSLFRYAQDKWSIREVIGHIIDTERVMSYRALRFARNDLNNLPGFNQDEFVKQSNHHSISLKDLVKEFRTERESNILFFRNLSEDSTVKQGIANNNLVSVRALAYIMAGHADHHLNVIKEKIFEIVMALLVLAYPQIEKKDFEWIQSIRSMYDERYFKVVDPHFTIVFPVNDIDENILIEHTEKISKSFREFYFVLRCSQIVKDSFSDYTDIFLIPEEGYRIFLKLHDLFYTGILEKELRLDIPFIPHLGIGNSLDAKKCKVIADDLNIKNVEVIGSINKLTVVSYNGSSVELRKEIRLKK